MTTNKATYTRTRDNGNSSVGVNRGHAFSPQSMAEEFGWQGTKHAHRGGQAPPRASARSLGNLEPGRIADLEMGRREAFDSEARTAAIMVGTYVGVRALQHWSAWKRQRGR